MPRPSAPQPAAHCPRCGGPLRRTRRGLGDRLINLLMPAGQARLRYACRAARCGWQGSLVRTQPQAETPG